MSPAAEVVLVAQRELRKNVRSAKGIALLVLSLLGGVVVALVLAWFEKLQARKARRSPAGGRGRGPAADHPPARRRRQALGDALSKAPGALLGALKVTIWFGPLLVRAPRLRCHLGRAAVPNAFATGRSARAALLSTSARCSGYGRSSRRSRSSFRCSSGGSSSHAARPTGAVVEWGPRLWAVTLPISLVWCGDRAARRVAVSRADPLAARHVRAASSCSGSGTSQARAAKVPALRLSLPERLRHLAAPPAPRPPLRRARDLSRLRCCLHRRRGRDLRAQGRMSDDLEVARGGRRRQPLAAQPSAQAANAEGAGASKKSTEKKSPEPAARLIQVTKTFGPTIAVNEVSLRIPAGCGLRAHRSERRGEDDDVLDARRVPRRRRRGEIQVLGHAPDRRRRAPRTHRRAPAGRAPPLERQASASFSSTPRASRTCRANKAEQLAREVARRGRRQGLVGHALRRALPRNGEAGGARAGADRRARGGPARRADGRARSARRVRGAADRQLAQGALHAHRLEPQPPRARAALRCGGDPRPRSRRRRGDDGGADRDERGDPRSSSRPVRFRSAPCASSRW